MIFQTINFVDSRLSTYAHKIEDKEIGLRVISGCVFQIPCILINISVSVTEPRRFNVLEEFVIRACMELSPAPSANEIASMFGLDKLFIDATFDSLKSLGVIKKTETDELNVTETGYTYIKQGFVPLPSEEREILLAYLCATDSLIYLKNDKLPIIKEGDQLIPGLINNNHENDHDDGVENHRQAELFTDEDNFEDDEDYEYEVSEDEDDYIACAVSSLNEETVVQAVINAGLGWHRPDEGRIVKWAGDYPEENYDDYDDENKFHDGHTIDRYLCGVLIIEDTAKITHEKNDNLSLRMFNLMNGKRDEKFEEIMAMRISEGSICYSDFYNPEYKNDIENELYQQVGGKLPQYKQQAIDLYQARIERERQKLKGKNNEIQKEKVASFTQGKVEFLWGEKIRPRFIETLRQAQHTLIIISPWITEEVIDQEFIDQLKELASRRVKVVMGWGISNNLHSEDRIPSDQLLNTLEKINTPEGYPSVSVWWLGNVHNKDFLVDYKINFSGSHNWLSYRGDRKPRGESAHFITILEPVQQALQSIEPLFDHAITSTWNNSISDVKKNLSLLRHCCSSWVAIRRVDNAFEHSLLTIQEKGRFAEGMDLLNTICATLARLPIAEINQILPFEEVDQLINRIAKMEVCLNNAEGEQHLLWLLGRYAQADGKEFRNWLEKNGTTFQKVGIYQPVSSIDSILGNLIDIAKHMDLKHNDQQFRDKKKKNK